VSERHRRGVMYVDPCTRIFIALRLRMTSRLRLAVHVGDSSFCGRATNHKTSAASEADRAVVGCGRQESVAFLSATRQRLGHGEWDENGAAAPRPPRPARRSVHSSTGGQVARKQTGTKRLITTTRAIRTHPSAPFRAVSFPTAPLLA